MRNADKILFGNLENLKIAFKMWTQMECNNETDLNETVSEVEIGVV
jgi:hypothetical protein